LFFEKPKRVIEKGEKMKFYEVFLRLISLDKEVGRTSIQLKSKSPFLASLEAEEIVDEIYGKQFYSSTISVDEITEDEYLFQVAC
jgi:hypothetical protein